MRRVLAVQGRRRARRVACCAVSGDGTQGSGAHAPVDMVGSALSFAESERKRKSGTSQMHTPKNDATSMNVGPALRGTGVCGRW